MRSEVEWVVLGLSEHYDSIQGTMTETFMNKRKNIFYGIKSKKIIFRFRIIELRRYT